MGMGLVLPLILQLMKLCIIFFVVAVQGSKGPIISPSPSFLAVIHPSGEAPGPVLHGTSWGSNAPISPSDQDGFVISTSPATLPVDPSPSKAPGILPPRDPWRTIAPSSPEVPKGPFLHPPVTLPPQISAPTPQKIKGTEPSISPSPSPSTITLSPPYKAVPAPLPAQGNVLPTSAPTPQRIKGIEPSTSFSPSPSTITLSPPYETVPAPSTAEGNVPPSVQPSPPQRKAHAIRPPESTPTAPAPIVIPSGNLPKTSPISQPNPRTITISPAIPAPSTAHGSAPPYLQPSPPQRKAPAVMPPVSTPTTPAPIVIPSSNLPKTSPISQPTPRTITISPAVPAPSNAQANVPPSVQPNPPQRKVHAIRPPESTLTAPAPVVIPSSNLPKTSPISQPMPRTITISPAVPAPSTAQGNVPPYVQPIPPQRKAPAVMPPLSTPTTPAPIAIPSSNLPKTSPISQPTPSRTITISPAVPALSTAQGNAPPYVQPIPPQRKAPAVMPPVSTPTTPATIAIPSGNLPKTSPVSQPSTRTITLSPLYKNVPAPSTTQGNVPPSIQPSPPQKKAPVARPPASTPIAPAPAAIPSSNLPKKSPVSQPIERGSLPPKVDKRYANESHTPEPVSPAPVAIPPTNLPKISPVSQPNEHGNLLPNVHREGANKSHSPISPAPIAVSLPQHSPASQPTEHESFPPTVHRRNSNRGHTLEPVTQAPVAIPPAILPDNTPVNQPTYHGSFPPNVHERTANKDHTHIAEPVPPQSIASPPWKMENNQSVGHPLFPKITPSILPAPVTSPTSAFPVIAPSVHPVIPAISPSKLPAPVVSPALTPSRSFNWEKGGKPVSAPLYKTPKPLPTVVHSPAQAPAADKAREFHHAPKLLISSPESPINKEDHFPVPSPSTTFYKHHHKRNIITSPAPASPYLISPSTSKHQDQPIPPPPMDTGSSVSPFAFPVLSPVSQVSPAPAPAPAPSFKISPHPIKIPFHLPKASPSRSSSMSRKTPNLPQIQALPPPPPNEDCLSTVCSDPYTNSPPGAPCRCIWPMKVGLRLSVPLYTFFPLVSELASEIAAGVFMRPSQVRIMGANVASQQPDKTIALIDLVPLGEEFDNTTAFLTSERFWHKQVAIKASYFGDYDVLYVSYPGLPPSPPLPPSSMSIIDDGPYSSDGNNGRTIKPIGVDTQKQQQHKGGLRKGIIAIIALSVFLAVVLCSAAAWAMFKYRDRVSQPTPTPTPRVLPPPLAKATGTAGSLVGGVASASSSFRSSIAAYTGTAKTFSMNDIEKATDNFHDSRILGEGGFGRVYSGILEDGTKVAFKVLKREDHHGDREFLAEIEMLSRLHHRNLVKLIGICTEVSFRCLVYELIPNGSVESHLHGVEIENSPFDWSARLKIALGAARGLAYLHEDSSPPVIHRDFKSSNILLEDDFTPKVSDFGLARIATDKNRHISTRVMGTFGYVAPEYAMTGHLLVKSDVYSYGVVLLELLTGRKPVDMSQPPGQENLVSWARPLLTSKEGLEAIIDPSVGTNVPFDSVAKVAAIASMCVQPEVSDRPFMGEVVQALKLVSNECDEAKEAGSKSSSQEDISALDLNTVSGHRPDNFQGEFSATNYHSGVDIEKGFAASVLFSSSARFGRQAFSGSLRRHSYSGPLRTGRRSRRLWQIIRRLSGGSVSEHGTMFK